MAPSLDTRFDYITVGHVTRDLLEDRPTEAAQPGGTAFYSALQASRLGLRTLIVTQGVPEEIEALIAPYRDELDLHVIAAQHTTTLSTRGLGALRSQRLLAWAGPILQPLELHSSILHFAPTLREGHISWSGGASFIGITPQGLIRRWAQDGEVSLVPLDSATLPSHFDAAVIGEPERESCHALFSAARHVGAQVAVTAGSRPTTVHLSESSAVQTAAVPVADVRDDIGAGDVFAAAFFISLSEGRSPLEAAVFGNLAAATRVAGAGPNAIGERARIVTP